MKEKNRYRGSNFTGCRPTSYRLCRRNWPGRKAGEIGVSLENENTYTSSVFSTGGAGVVVQKTLHGRKRDVERGGMGASPSEGLTQTKRPHEGAKGGKASDQDSLTGVLASYFQPDRQRCDGAHGCPIPIIWGEKEGGRQNRGRRKFLALGAIRLTI